MTFSPEEAAQKHDAWRKESPILEGDTRLLMLWVGAYKDGQQVKTYDDFKSLVKHLNKTGAYDIYPTPSKEDFDVKCTVEIAADRFDFWNKNYFHPNMDDTSLLLLWLDTEKGMEKVKTYDRFLRVIDHLDFKKGYRIFSIPPAEDFYACCTIKMAANHFAIWKKTNPRPNKNDAEVLMEWLGGEGKKRVDNYKRFVAFTKQLGIEAPPSKEDFEAKCTIEMAAKDFCAWRSRRQGLWNNDTDLLRWIDEKRGIDKIKTYDRLLKMADMLSGKKYGHRVAPPSEDCFNAALAPRRAETTAAHRKTTAPHAHC